MLIIMMLELSNYPLFVFKLSESACNRDPTENLGNGGLRNFLLSSSVHQVAAFQFELVVNNDEMPEPHRLKN